MTPKPDPGRLYELSDNPQCALDEIRHAYPSNAKGKREELRKAVEELLTQDDYVQPKVVRTIADAYETCADDEGIRGPLGLYLGLYAATELALSFKQDGDRRDQVDEMLKVPATTKCLRRFYGIDDIYDLANARLHRIGTTSLILRCPLSDHGGTQQVVALKCLLPRYHRVKAIRERTAKYKEDRSIDSPVAPCVIESTSLTVAMEFVEGETLAERFEARIQHRRALKENNDRHALYDDDVKFVREVGLEICKCLEELSATGNTHLDLSPSNIIVVSDERDYRMRIRLIDFGQNFAITERVGSAAAYRRASLYVAPELIQGTSEGSWRCDAYSLGIILLEAAAITELRREDLAFELERLWQGERPWEGAPQIGRIVDELLDDEMGQRLALYEGPDADSAQPAYDYLQKLIRQETEALEHYQDQTNGSGFGLLRGFGLLKVYKNTQLVNMLRAAKASEESVDDAYADFPALANWAIVSMIAWVLAVGAFAMMTSADLGWKTVEPWAEQISKFFGNQYEVGVDAFWENVMGRLVALTFGLTAVTYYVNNLATLSPKRLDLRIGWMSHGLMRLTSFVFAGPILYVIFCDPEGWPLLAGAATLIVVWNNYVALRIGSRAFDVFQAHFTPKGTGGYKFVNDVFKEWWLLMFWYALAMIGIGTLLKLDIAKDESIFAVLVIIANVVKLYRTNCVETAPQVRGCLARAILTLRRANQLFPANEIREPKISRPRRGPFAAISKWWWESPSNRHRRRHRWQQRPTAS